MNSKPAKTVEVNCPGFDEGCILWEDVAHVSIEAADAQAWIGTPASGRAERASGTHGPGDHEGDRRASRCGDANRSTARTRLGDPASLGQAGRDRQWSAPWRGDQGPAAHS